MSAKPPFNPSVPQQPVDVRRFATQVVDYLNRPHRNEFTVAVPVPPPVRTLGPWSADQKYTARSAGWSPRYEGMVLRRVRFASATSKDRTYLPFSGASVKALVQVSGSEDKVGSFSSYDFAVNAGSARVVSGPVDIDRPLPPESVFAVEVTYTSFPPAVFEDTVMLFDVGVL